MGKNSLFLSPQIHSFLFSFKEMRTLRELSHQTLGAKWGEGGSQARHTRKKRFCCKVIQLLSSELVGLNNLRVSLNTREMTANSA